MIDAETPGSPGWWLKRLAEAQAARLPKLRRLYRYFEGDHDMPEGHDKAREAFRAFQRKARSNYTGLVAESVIERARPIGFRVGTAGADDPDAWQIWAANRMNADIRLAIRAAVSMGESYLLVGPPDGSAGQWPVITAEDPREFIAEMDPIRKREPLAALKIWADEMSGERRAVLYLPDAMYGFTAPLIGDTYQGAGYEAFNVQSWSPAGQIPNAIGRVPVARMPNRMDLFGHVKAEFADVIDIQDRINSAILDRMVMIKMQAYRQRWIKGTSLTDENGDPVPLTPGADILWVVEDEDAEFGEFQQSDIRPVLEAVKDDVRDLAAISRTPPHYLMAEFTNAGGDAFAQSETGHVAKVGERLDQYGEAIESAARLAYYYLGDPRADDLTLSTVWADPQYRSLAEKADAATKLVAAGVPWRTVMISVMGYSLEDVARMEAERASDALTAALSALAAPASPQAISPTPAEGE